MEKIVIVVGDRKNPHAHHLKLTGPVRVGRALSCDVILSDEHAEPLQLVFFEQEEVRKVQVLAGVNPVTRNGEAVAPGIYDFVSGEEWGIGRTLLQAFSEHHTLEPTRKLVMREYQGSTFAEILVSTLAALALFGCTLLGEWLGSYDVLEWKKMMISVLTEGGIIFVFVWAAFWSVVARLVNGRNQFVIHFVAASLFVLLDMSGDVVTSYLSYGTNHTGLWQAVIYSYYAVMFTALVYITLSYALNVRTALGSLAISVFFVLFIFVDEMLDKSDLAPDFDSAIKPPFALWVDPQGLEAFDATMDAAFAEVDEQRDQ